MSTGLSVIIPVLNEEEIIEANTARLVQYLEGLKQPHEVILVSNGSTDRTESLGVALADMTSFWEEMLEHKRDWDLTGNGVNHPNDFGHRVYAQVLSSLLISSFPED